MKNNSSLEPEKKYQFLKSCEFREFRENLVNSRVTGCELFANFLRISANSQENINLLVKFAIIQRATDVIPKPFFCEWALFVDALKTPQIRPDKNGKAVIFAEFSKQYRSAKNVTAVTALGFDVEVSKEDGTFPPPAHEASLIVSKMGTEAVIYTTYSHDTHAPRYRVIFPLDDGLPPPDLKPSLSIFADAMPELSHWFDRTCKDAARLFFLPACPPDKAALFEHYHIPGSIVKVGTLQTLIAHKKAAQDAQRAAKRQLSGNNTTPNFCAHGGVIQRFNAAFPLADILQTHGYERRGKRWLSPGSGTGIAGVHVFEDGKMYSHHNDDLGRNGTLLDAFEAFALLEHGGDKSAAVKAAARLLEVRP